MAKIQGGTLEYEVLLNTKQINGMLEETKRRIQGFSDATVAGGAKMETAYQAASQQIKQGFDTIGDAMRINQTAIAELQKRYNELGTAAAAAFQKGDYNKYNQITQQGGQLSVIQKEIGERQRVVAELEKSDAVLVKYNKDLEDQKNKVDNASNANVRFRTQLLNVKNEMMQLEQAGKRNTAEYARLTEEAKRLANAMYAANSQIKTLTSVKGATLQGFVSGLSGVSGAFTAVNGAMGLFATKNEELQKTMMKVQSLMSITMGLQAISATLHQTSAFRLTVLTKVQTAYNAVLFSSGKALIKFGLSANAARAAVQLLYGTLTLGLAVAIPVVIGLISKFISKQNEAKKAIAEFHKSVAEEASKPIAAFKKLQAEWTNVGDNFQKKMSILKDLKKMFEELGVSINGVIEAEKILTSPSNVNAFISAQVAKARAKAKQSELEKLEKEAAIAKQQLEDAWKKPTKRVFYADGSMGTVANPEIEKQDKALQTARDKMAAAITDMGKYQKEAYEQAQKAIEGAIITYADGTVGALEQAIAKEKETLESLKGDNAAYRAKLEDIARIQEQIDAITGKSKEKKAKAEKDSVIKEMEEKKKAYQEYFKWINAGLEKEAKQEFAKLLESGATYKDYLEKRRQDTALTKEQIHQINNEIAADANKTVMGEFQKSLQEEMNRAKSILELIELIKKRREELEKSDDPLKVQKLEIITQKKDEYVVEKVKEDYNRAAEEYSDYLDSKIKMDVRYFNKREKLKKALSDTDDSKTKAIIQQQIEILDFDYKKDSGAMYDEMLKEYGTFEQKKQAIIDEYATKRKIAEQQGNKNLVAELEKAEKKAVSKLASETIIESDLWKKLFADIDKKTLKEIDDIIKQINAKTLDFGVEFTDEDIKKLKTELEALRNDVANKNPFTALSLSLEKFNREASVSNLEDLLEAGSDLAGNFSDIADAMHSIAEEIGSAKLEQAADLMGDILGNFQAAQEGAEAWGGWWGAIIGGVTDLVPKIIKWANGDRKIEKSIQQHAEAVAQLTSAYNDLQWQIDKALGEAVYKNQKAAIANMRQQQEQLLEMARLEGEKKKSDGNKIAAYQEQYAEVGRQIEQMIADISESITQTTAKDLANQLADALVSAYEKGEDAAKSFEEVSRKVIQNAVKNALKLKWLDEPLQAAIASLQKDMGFDAEGNGTFDELTQAEQDKFKQAVNMIASQFNQAMEMYKDVFEDLEDTEGPASSLSGAIKGASQESIDLLAGQTNAVRVNQVQSIELLRNQLLHLARIDMKIDVSNRHLESIDNKISTTHDILRSQGITD